MIASYVGVPITAEIPNGESVIVVQEILDGIMPCLLPLGLTFGLYGLVKRGLSTCQHCYSCDFRAFRGIDWIILRTKKRVLSDIFDEHSFL